jgi:hypothetical protein
MEEDDESYIVDGNENEDVGERGIKNGDEYGYGFDNAEN